MRMWPQFNTGFAIVKIKQIFLYNSECIIFETENLCSSKTLHKCCSKFLIIFNVVKSTSIGITSPYEAKSHETQNPPLIGWIAGLLMDGIRN